MFKGQGLEHTEVALGKGLKCWGVSTGRKSETSVARAAIVSRKSEIIESDEFNLLILHGGSLIQV